MLTATLIISQPGHATHEVESSTSSTSIGSALDNTVCLEANAGVGRYHAVIRRRDDEYWLTDLDTRQLTKVNDEPIYLERLLADGDRITLGSECVIEFYRHQAAPHAAQPTSNDSYAASELSYAASSATGAGLSTASSSVANVTSATSLANTTTAASGGAAVATDAAGASLSPAAKVGLGVGAGLVLTGAAAVLFFNPFGSGCQPSVRLLTPLNGATLRAATTIRVEAHEQQCIKRVSYQLDGTEIASAALAPYEAALDPARLTRFAPGTHVLTATIETTDGTQARQPGEIYVALNAANNGGAQPPAPAPTVEPADTPVEPSNTTATASDVQVLSERLASQITGKSGYIFEREMIAKIQAHTGEFAAVDAPARAARQRRFVVKAFSDRGLKPLVGFVLALSRSKLADAAQADGADWWRIPPAIAQAYLQPGEAPAALRDPRRAAEIAAVYLKDLLGVFDTENLDLAVACYGSTLEEAGTLKQQLAATPAAERRDFWLLVTRGLVKPEQAERVVKFYAAGIVGENPQRFGAASTQPLSTLE